MNFTLQAVELQSKKVSFLNVLSLRESSTGKTRSLANAALDIFTILLLFFWLLISAQPPKTRKQMYLIKYWHMLPKLSYLHFPEFSQRNCCVYNPKWRGGITLANNIAREPKDSFVGVLTWYNPPNSPAAICQHLPRGVPQSAWQGGWRESTKRNIRERRKGGEKSRMGRVRKQSKGRRVIREKTGLGRAQQ